MIRTSLLVLAAVAAIGGCSRTPTIECEDPSRYASSRSAPPVRVPDDLTVPDETDALRIPDPMPGEEPASEQCLQVPPDFFGSQDEPEEDA